MTSSFSSKFITLRKERKLSIRDISLMTGVSTKEVKKWEKGSALPNGTRVVRALEGLLGENICKDFSIIDEHAIDDNLEVEPLFSVDETIFKERRNMLGRLKEKFIPARIVQQRNSTDYIKIEPSEEIHSAWGSFESIVNTGPIKSINDLDVEQEEIGVLEFPYINDPDQIMIYWKRNFKTFLILLLFLMIGFRSLSMFWENITLFIDNLI